jgi:hypothetical protein
MKCANPHCRTETLYLRSGTLHSIDCVEGEGEDAISRRIIWLCELCSQVIAVEPWRAPGEQLRPRSKLTSPAAALPRVATGGQILSGAKAFSGRDR